MSKSWEAGSDSRWRRFRLTILKRDKHVCTLGLVGCTKAAEHVHHITPLSKGGDKYDPANCAASCASCNTQLGNRDPKPQPEPRPTTEW